MQYLLGMKKHDFEIANIHWLQINNGTAVTKEEEQNFIMHGNPEPNLQRPLRIYWQHRLSPYNVCLASQFANVLIYNFPEMKDDVHDIENHFLDRIKTLNTFIRATKEASSKERAAELVGEHQKIMEKRSRLTERRLTVRSFQSHNLL